jgi:putative transposase
MSSAANCNAAREAVGDRGAAAQSAAALDALHGVHLRHSQPRTPNQNAYIERLDGSYRKEVLDAHLFDSLDDVRAETERWLTIYNARRPHHSLGRVPPLTFLPRLPAPLESSSERSA